jgi:hypothetical protein
MLLIRFVSKYTILFYYYLSSVALAFLKIQLKFSEELIKIISVLIRGLKTNEIELIVKKNREDTVL